MRSDVIRSAKASKIATDQRIRCDLTTDLLGSGRPDVFLQLVVFWNWYEEKIDRRYKTWRAAVKKYALIVKPCKPNGRSNDALDDRSDDTRCARTSGQTATCVGRSRKTARSFSITNAYVADAISCKKRLHALAGGYRGDSANRASC